MAERPILILATGPRCGSTLLQRILSTHPGVFIWGEHGGQLDPMLSAADTFAAWSNNQAARAGKEFESAGTSGFMANLAPPESVLRDQVRTMIAGLFRRLPETAAVPEGFRWGFKEIRYGADFVRRFAAYFPQARVVYLTRDPISVLRSLDWWERTSNGFWGRERTVAALESWRDLNASFLAASDLAELVLPVRYEDLTRAETVGAVCAFVDVSEHDLDRTVLADVVHAPAPWGRRPRALTPRQAIAETYRELLDDPELNRVAGQLGYGLAVHA